jgi:hypothetical protein
MADQAAAQVHHQVAQAMAVEDTAVEAMAMVE